MTTLVRKTAREQINRRQTKILSSDITVSGTTVTDLTFNNLITGKLYQIDLNAFLLTNDAVANPCEGGVVIQHDSVDIGSAYIRNDAPGDTTADMHTTTAYFVASAPTLTFFYTRLGNGQLSGNGTKLETHATLIELNTFEVVETTDYT